MSVIEIQPGDPVTIKLPDTYFDGKTGVYVKTLSEREIKKLTKEKVYDDRCGPIVIDLISMDFIYFNSHMNDHIPKEEKKWLFMKEEEIVLRKKGSEAGPLSIGEIIELELSLMTNPPYIRVGYIPSRVDGKCCIQDCNDEEHDGIWFNVWGSGTRIPVCKKHFVKHGKLTWSDSIFIKLKNE